jgi:hypothetical protein
MAGTLAQDCTQTYNPPAASRHLLPGALRPAAATIIHVAEHFHCSHKPFLESKSDPPPRHSMASLSALLPCCCQQPQHCCALSIHTCCRDVQPAGGDVITPPAIARPPVACCCLAAADIHTRVVHFSTHTRWSAAISHGSSMIQEYRLTCHSMASPSALLPAAAASCCHMALLRRARAQLGLAGSRCASQM